MHPIRPRRSPPRASPHRAPRHQAHGAAVAALALLAAGCDDDPVRPGEGLVPLSVSFAMTAPGPAHESGPTVSGLTISFDSVRLVRGARTQCEPHDNGACPILVRDTVRVVFPPPGQTFTPLAVAAPEGRYGALALRVRGVRLRGTSDGRAFSRAVTLRVPLLLPLPSTLTLEAPTAETVNLTVLAHADRLLLDPEGGAVDPIGVDDEKLARLLTRTLPEALIAFRDDSRTAIRNLHATSSIQSRPGIRPKLRPLFGVEFVSATMVEDAWRGAQ